MVNPGCEGCDENNDPLSPSVIIITGLFATLGIDITSLTIPEMKNGSTLNTNRQSMGIYDIWYL